jgi:CDP-glycerol glycerophosphotransferase (TagB/SpsB family)
MGLSQDQILLIPTWRKYLTLQNEVPGKRRLKCDGFYESKFFRNWNALLNSEELRQTADRFGLRLVFALHPNMTMYLEDMNVPDWVSVADVSKFLPYQDIFSRSRAAITDFSSAVSEVAYLQRPVIYFQFDADEMFKGGHVYKKGYFSFERDGFGPVVRNPEDVVAQLDAALSGREDPVYAARRHAAFPFRDGGCCERVCMAIEQLTEPRPVLAPAHAT